MGRYSTDSEEESKKRKKKKKKRSRSRERSESIESRYSTKPKKSKKKKKKKSRSRSRSRSVEKYSRRSRSRSYDRSARSRSRERYRRRSRSYSRGRYSRSRSRNRDSRRRRSRSYDSYSRSSRRSYTPDKKSKRDRSSERQDPCANIPGFAEMTPSEQAKIRMHMALKAAAAADEKIKGDMSRSSSGTTLQESMAFSQAIQDIESSGFSATSFKSNRGEKEDKPVIKDEFTFGTAGELRLDSQRKPVLVDVDNEELAHHSLYTDPAEKLTKWIQKLAAMRRKKLEGEVIT